MREAETRVVASARQYDSLRDQTQEDVKDLFAQIHSQQELLRLLREEIVPKAEQTFEVSLRAYEVGEVTFLQQVDNWRQLLTPTPSMKALPVSGGPFIPWFGMTIPIPIHIPDNRMSGR